MPDSFFHSAQQPPNFDNLTNDQLRTLLDSLQNQLDNQNPGGPPLPSQTTTTTATVTTTATSDTTTAEGTSLSTSTGTNNDTTTTSETTGGSTTIKPYTKSVRCLPLINDDHPKKRKKSWRVMCQHVSINICFFLHMSFLKYVFFEICLFWNMS